MTDFILARNYTPANRSEIRAICIHTMENPEKPGTARAVAKWFASPTAPQASAHACVDNTEVVLCVKPTSIAWGAPHLNRDGYHVEHAGYARQTLEDWSDDYSAQMLRISARHTADVAKTWGIPPHRLTVAEVADGKTKGFCGHADVTAAFKTPGGHTDPGKGFPWDLYLAMVVEETDALVTPIPEENPLA